MTSAEISSDLPAPEWVYFEDRNLSRALLYVHHEDDPIGDRDFPCGAMTVFGFGRTHNNQGSMSAPPKH